MSGPGQRSMRAAIVGSAAMATAAFMMIAPAPPANAHHCGASGTHAKDGSCLNRIKSGPAQPSQSGQATGKRQHKPFRARMYYDQ